MNRMRIEGETLKTFGVFLIVGLSVALFQYITFYVLLEQVRAAYLVSSSISFFLTVIVSYLLQKHVTFRGSRDTVSRLHTGTRFSLFVGNSLFGLLLNGIIMYIGVDVFGNSAYITQVVSMGFLALYNFFVYRFLFT